MRRERFSLPLTCEFSESDTGLNFTGLAVAYNRPINSWVPTELAPGVFAECLADASHRSRIRILYQHDERTPIGRPTDMVETAEGLSVAGKLANVASARDVVQLVREGIVTDLSVGFDVLAHEDTKGANGEVSSRRITAGKLWEFSFVTWGASAEAKIDQLFARSFGGRSWSELNANLRALTAKFSGRTISAATREKIQAAIDTLSALLATPEIKGAEDDDEEMSTPIPAEVITTLNDARLMLAAQEVSRWT